MVLDSKTLGKRLKAVREYLNENPRQFAMQAGVDPSQYAKTEGEKGKGLGAQKIKDLCSTWNINYDWLVTGKGEMIKGDPNSKDKKIEQDHIAMAIELEQLKALTRVLRSHVASLEDQVFGLRHAAALDKIDEEARTILRGLPTVG